MVLSFAQASLTFSWYKSGITSKLMLFLLISFCHFVVSGNGSGDSGAHVIWLLKQFSQYVYVYTASGIFWPNLNVPLIINEAILTAFYMLFMWFWTHAAHQNIALWSWLWTWITCQKVNFKFHCWCNNVEKSSTLCK